MADTRWDVIALGLLAAAGVAATDVAYLRIIESEGSNANSDVVAFLGIGLAVLAILFAAGSLLRDHRLGAIALALASGGCLMLGVIGLFSIGMFLLLSGLAGALATVGAVRRSGTPSVAFVSALLGVVLALGGFKAVAS